MCNINKNKWSNCILPALQKLTCSQNLLKARVFSLFLRFSLVFSIFGVRRIVPKIDIGIAKIALLGCLKGNICNVCGICAKCRTSDGYIAIIARRKVHIIAL